MQMSDKERFLEVMKGIPAGFIATAILYSKNNGGGVNYRGCSKTDIFNGLFKTHSNTLEKLPSLEELRDSAVDWQKQAKITTAENRKAYDINLKKRLRYPKLTEETIEVFQMGISLVNHPSEVPFTAQDFVEKAQNLINEWKNQ